MLINKCPITEKFRPNNHQFSPFGDVIASSASPCHAFTAGWPEPHFQTPLLFQLFESWSGSDVFSNLRIRHLFKLRKPLLQSKFNNICNNAMPFLKATQTLAAAENKNVSGSGSGFSEMFDYTAPVSGPKNNEESCSGRLRHSGSEATSHI